MGCAGVPSAWRLPSTFSPVLLPVPLTITPGCRVRVMPAGAGTAPAGVGGAPAPRVALGLGEPPPIWMPLDAVFPPKVLPLIVVAVEEASAYTAALVFPVKLLPVMAGWELLWA